MQSKKIFVTGIFMLAALYIVHAEENDSVSIPLRSDSTAISSKSKYDKPLKMLGIAVPVSMIAYGVISLESDGLKELDISIRNELLEDNSMWYNKWDDYLQFSPAVAAFGMNLCGVKSTHKFLDMFALYALSNVLSTSFVYTTKQLTARSRPDDSNRRSFPSGHTVTAFVAAEFLHQEYKDKSIWISISGYGMASLVGIFRIYNNKHWVSDVLAGAGAGILSTKFVYWSYPYLQKAFRKKETKRQSFIFPEYDKGNLSLNFTCIF